VFCAQKHRTCNWQEQRPGTETRAEAGSRVYRRDRGRGREQSLQKRQGQRQGAEPTEETGAEAGSRAYRRDRGRGRGQSLQKRQGQRQGADSRAEA